MRPSACSASRVTWLPDVGMKPVSSEPPEFRRAMKLRVCPPKLENILPTSTLPSACIAKALTEPLGMEAAHRLHLQRSAWLRLQQGGRVNASWHRSGRALQRSEVRHRLMLFRENQPDTSQRDPHEYDSHCHRTARSRSGWHIGAGGGVWIWRRRSVFRLRGADSRSTSATQQ